MAPATYHRAASVDEATSLLAEYGDEAKVLAGGQSLIPMISLGLARPGHLVDIGAIGGLGTAEVDDGIDGGVRIGALVRHRALEASSGLLEQAAPLLSRAAPYIGHEAIRTRGTFVGSIVHGDPAGEWPAVAVALDAEIELQSPRGERTVAARDFFLGPLTTDVADDELAVAVRLPVASPSTGAAALELAYRHGDYAVVGVLAQLTLDGERVVDARVGLLGVGGTPIRATSAEAAARGGPPAFADAGHAAAAECDPLTDATASAAYRRRMVAVYVRRALGQAFADAVRRRATPLDRNAGPAGHGPGGGSR
jgi:carbon-monoxide dehydrogenase medium subunit